MTLTLAIIPSTLRELATEPSYRKHLLIPIGIALLAFFPLFWIFWSSGEYLYSLLPDITPAWLPDFLEGGLEKFLRWISFITIGLGCSILASLCAFIITNLAAALALETFVEAALKKHGLLPPEQSLSLLDMSLRVTRLGWEALIKLSVLALLGILLFISSFFPFGPLFVFGLGAFILGFDIFDTALTPTGKRFKERLEVMSDHNLELLSVGIIASLVLLVPFVAVLLLPFPYLVAVRRIKDWRP